LAQASIGSLNNILEVPEVITNFAGESTVESVLHKAINIFLHVADQAKRFRSNCRRRRAR